MAVAPSSFFRKRFNILTSPIVECFFTGPRERRTRHPSQTHGDNTVER
jgi:hypothetical protein